MAPSKTPIKKSRRGKELIKHVQLGVTPVNGSIKPLRASSKTRFLLNIPSPPSSEDLLSVQSVGSSQARVSTNEGNRGTRSANDSGLWIDLYSPRSSSDLAVHKRKVDAVRHWIEEALDGGLNKQLKKYRKLLALTGPAGSGKTATVQALAREMGFEIVEWQNFRTTPSRFAESDQETLSDKFSNFLSHISEIPQQLDMVRQSSEAATLSSTPRHTVVLLEDLPNLLHSGTKEAFQLDVEDFITTPGSPPLLLIVSESGRRGMEPESFHRDMTWDIRSILGSRLLQNPSVAEIQCIQPTLIDHRMLPHTLNAIVEGSMGDVRSAINALQFACRLPIREIVKGKARVVEKNGRREDPAEAVKQIIQGITRNEQVLALFHMLGKILYNKHSPVDVSLLLPYLHHNYPLFCLDLEDLEAASARLSDGDTGEVFHFDSEMGQKLGKSPYWDFGQSERDARQSLRSWARHDIFATRDAKPVDMIERAWLVGRTGGLQHPGILDLASMPWGIQKISTSMQLLDETAAACLEDDTTLSQTYGMESEANEDQGAGTSLTGWIEEDDIEEA
ncbi:Rad17-domain-containing protein [Calocera cornea HHB12733]|uniref:Rad17-domain-containing protein n=1 Tax=Calocera cornea HHB12733 TaxID=1353952 RepID=A0A165DE40_9BASI|nr:Rad17-domain-containing protein [Calocera cornea HHB12733]